MISQVNEIPNTIAPAAEEQTMTTHEVTQNQPKPGNISMSKKILPILLMSLSAAGAALAADGPASADPSMSEIASQMQTLRDAMASLEARRVQLEQDMDALRAKLAAGTETAPAETIPARPASVVVKPGNAVEQPAKSEEPPAPLSIRIGSAEFTPGGFLDFLGVFRSTNVGSGEATTFGTIPFANTPQGQLSENRYSAQQSRISLKITSRYRNTDLMGYVEADFLGAQPASGLVTSNSNPLRLRLYFVDVSHGGWEVLGGQAWSMLTPNRTGISAMPSDLFYGIVADPNYLAGLTWTRAPLVRVLRHWNPNWTSGVSFESPDQFVGTAVVLPTSMFTSQLDGGASVATPSLYPDIISKTAFDGHLGTRSVHIEAAGLLRGFRVVNQVNERVTRNGGGGSVNFNLETIRNLHLIVNTFYSSGGGRYILGLGPDLVLQPNGTPSLVRAASGIGGLEYQITPGWMVAAYQGGAYFGRDYSLTGSGPIGFGYPGSTNAANRTVQESTLSVVRTLWKRADLGALQIIGQYSYVWRDPWSVAVGAPASAHTNMTFADLRYILP